MGITLGKKTLSKGRISLYIDYCHQGRRKKEYLGIILERPDTSDIRKENRRKLLIANQIRAKKELAFLSALYEVNRTDECFSILQDTPPARVTDFFRLMNDFLSHYRKKDRKMVEAALLHLHRFHKKRTLPTTLLTKDFCTAFLDYLRERLHGNTPVGYFKKFRMCLDWCVESGLLPSNPAKGIRLMQFDEVTKHILSLKEIQKLALTACPNDEVKRAFLFSCYSGLRWCDIYRLQYQDVDFQAKRITLVQQKVQGRSRSAILHLNLSATAIKLLQPENVLRNQLVFNLPSYSYSLRILRQWTAKAGIRKHITFHCARHSFITHIMAKGANIKTAASLAGHSTTRHTEKYVHIIDELKQKAVDSLPDITVTFR